MSAKRKHRIHVAELSMSGVFHAGVNAGLVRVMRGVYPGHELVFYGERNHLDAVRERLGGIPATYGKFPGFPRATKYTLPLRDILGIIYLLCIFFRTRKGDTVFVTNLLPLTHWTGYVWNRFFRRPFFVCLHGQLEAFLPGTPLRATKWYFRGHGPLFRRDSRTHYVILGEPVYRVVRSIFGPEAKIIVIDHPYDYGMGEVQSPEYAFPLRFGHPGTGNRGKGTPHLFRLAELLREEIEAGKVEFYGVGRLDPALRPIANPWVVCRSLPLTAEEYGRQMASLHYTLLFRDSGLGRAVPAGSFFDSLKYGKPFLSLDSGFVSHYAERFPGCGTVFSSVEAMADGIRELCRVLDKQHYHDRLASLEGAVNALSVNEIVRQFKTQGKQ